MKAVVWTKYGPPEVLRLEEVEKPSPKDNQVLIRIYATTVTAGDCEMRSLRFPLYLRLPLRLWVGYRKPRGTTIPGTELAGVVEAAGKDVKRFKAGDPVFGSTGLMFGTCAEYLCVAETAGGVEGSLAVKPVNMSYAEAASVPFGGRDALHFLRKADLSPGQKILIVGAGGSIGTFAVQLARRAGAEVTAVDSTGKLDMLRSLGAEHVIDYTREDFTQNGVRYDVIFDVVGKISLSRSAPSLKPEGIFLLANPGLSQHFAGLWMRMMSRRKVVTQTASGSLEDLLSLKELVGAGQLTAVIDRSFPLDQIVEAHRYVESGQKQGNVVIQIVPETGAFTK